MQFEQELLCETDLTLAKVKEICCANEVTQNHIKALHKEADIAVNIVSKKKLQDKPM